MHYAVTFFAADAIKRMREAMPPQIQEVLDDAAKQGHETSYGFETEDEASRFVHSMFPDVVGGSPSVEVDSEGQQVVRLLLYRDLASITSTADPAAKVEALPTDHIEEANLVMRTLLPYDFNLWMPPERAAEVAASMRRLMPADRPSS